MLLSELDVENEFTKKLPQYIRQYENFFKFMKMLSNYILKSIEYADTILNSLDFNDTTLDGDVLIKIAKRVNVVYDKAYIENMDNYYNSLRVGIYGMQTKRLSTGTLYDLNNALTSVIPGVESVLIKDNYDMTADIKIVGYIETLDKSIIENYILPRVTGVKFNVSYIPYNKDLFAFNKEEDVLDEKGQKLYGEYGWDDGEWAPMSTKY